MSADKTTSVPPEVRRALEFFGTDGIRGAVGGPCIQPAFFYRLGRALARFAQSREGAAAAPRVLVGRDTRASGQALENAFCAGFAAEGGEGVPLGILPTPALAWTLKKEGAAVAAMITASHNPARDNGIKFFLPPGRKLQIAEEEVLEEILAGIPVATPPLEEPSPELPPPPPGEAVQNYGRQVREAFGDLDLGGTLIALDCAHGATFALAPEIFRALGARLLTRGDAPDGTNINRAVGSEHTASLAAWVRESGAAVGIAFDGDGDRVQFCDHRGEILDGDALLYILAREDARLARTPGLLVATVQSNLGLDKALNRLGIQVRRTAVGDRNVSEAMQQEGAHWGGESSGHLINSDFQWTGDGLVAALSILRLWQREKGDWASLREGFVPFPQATAKVEVPAKPPLETLPGLSAAMRTVAAALAGEGRMLIRYSGTEPVLRFLVEAPSTEAAEAHRATLVEAVKADFSRLSGTSGG